MTMRCAVLLGTPIDDVTLAEAVDRIGEMIEEGRATDRVHQVATVNVDFVVNAARDATLRSILYRSDLSIPDGMGIVWGAKVIGVPLRQRTSGADLIPALAERAGRDGWRLCLFGGAPGVAAAAAQVLRERSPQADVVGLEAPTIDAAGTMDPTSAEALREVDADVVGVALGNPKQERWIGRFGASVGAPVYIGIGGSLDFITGATRRAPVWVQRAGLEWIHRAASEPRRLVGRYARDLVVFGPGLAAQAWRGRRRRSAQAFGVEENDSTVTVDVGGLGALDNATAAELVGLARQAARRRQRVHVIGVSPAVRASAMALRLDEVLMPR